MSLLRNTKASQMLIRSLCTSNKRFQSSIQATSSLRNTRSQSAITTSIRRPWSVSTVSASSNIRNHSNGRSLADEIATQLQELYEEARDEFEIASESTEVRAVYAAEDRQAARDELDALKAAWQKALEGDAAEELKQRPIGQRIRELDNAIAELSKADFEE